MDSTFVLNPVLLGYWCNLFKSLLKTHAYEVYNYVFEHSDVLEKMLDHLDSPQMSEVLVKLLNSQESPFKSTKQSADDIMTETAAKSDSSSGSSAFSENAAQEIRQCTVFSIIQRLSTEYSFE